MRAIDALMARHEMIVQMERAIEQAPKHFESEIVRRFGVLVTFA